MAQRFKIRNDKTSLLLDGAATTVTVTDSVSMQPTTAITTAVYFKRGKMGSASVVFGRPAGTTDYAPTIQSTNDIKLNLKLSTSNVNINTSGIFVVQKDVWYQVVCTYDSATQIAAIYVNGVLIKTGTGTGTLTNTGNWAVGGSGGLGFMLGVIKNVRMWNIALTATQISELYFKELVPQVGLACEFLFNEGGGSTPIDSSNNKNVANTTSGNYSIDVPFQKRSEVHPNLIPNGNFELYPPGNVATTTSSRIIDGTAGGSSAAAPNALPLRWIIAGGTGTFSALYDRTIFKTGSASLKLSISAVTSYIEVFQSTIFGGSGGYNQKSIPVLPSTSYTYSFWMKTNYVSGTATNGAAINFIESKNDGSDASHQTLVGYVKTTTDWTFYTGTITTTSSTSFILVNPLIYGHQGAATLIMDAWFDEITLKPTTVVTRTAQSSLSRFAVRDFKTSLKFLASAATNTVAITHASQYTFGKNLTCNMWFNPSSLSSDAALLSKAIGSKNPFDWRFVNSIGQVSFICYDGTFQPIATTSASTNLIKGRWYMLTGVRDGTNIKLYINGVLISSTTDTTVSSTDNTSDINIGHRTSGTQYIDGNIDDVTIWNIGLNATQISQLYYNNVFALQSNIVGRWQLNGGGGSAAVDSSGYNNNGTITGATYSTDVPMISRIKNVDKKTSLYFDGTAGSYLTVPDSAALSVTTDFTISGYVKPYVLSTDNRIFSRGSSATGNFGFGYNQLGQLKYTNYNVADVLDTGGKKLISGRWNHIAITKTGTSYTFYIDGVKNSVITDASAPTDTAVQFFLGARGAADQSITGKLKDVRIFNVALTPTQISDLFYKSIIPQSTLVGEWKLDEGAGTTALDTSNNKNNGTITGAVYTTDIPN